VASLQPRKNLVVIFERLGVRSQLLDFKIILKNSSRPKRGSGLYIILNVFKMLCILKVFKFKQIYNLTANYLFITGVCQVTFHHPLSVQVQSNGSAEIGAIFRRCIGMLI
jgi:hypothetical protein